MYILTPENRSLNIELIPDKVDDDIRYSVLDLTNTKFYDFYFLPLVYLESFNAPSVVLQIGEHYIKMPCLEPPNDWKILIGEPELGMLEAVSLEDINSRDFMAFTFNPISSFRPAYAPIRIVDTFPDLKWFMPTLPTNYILTVPLENGEKPRCVYFVNGVTGRKVDSIDIADII
jgi:hypothetical protein